MVACPAQRSPRVALRHAAWPERLSPFASFVSFQPCAGGNASCMSGVSRNDLVSRNRGGLGRCAYAHVNVI